MLDLRLIREQPEAVERALAGKGGAEHVKDIVAHDTTRRRLLKEAEELKALRNRASEAIGQASKRGEDASADMARMREVGERIKALDDEVKDVDARIEALLVQMPNLPHPSVPRGRSEDDNVEVRRWGTPRAFPFAPKTHDEVGEALGLLDPERAVKIAKARFNVLWGPAARLERALGQFMLDLHTREHGYTEVWVPHLVNGATMLKTGQLPKFEEGLFKTVEPDENRTLYLIPTAEVLVDRAPQRGNPGGGDAASPLHGSHALLSAGSGYVRQGHEGPLPPAPVREGGAGEDRDAGPVVRRARVAGAQRRGGAAAARAAVPSGRALRRRFGLQLGQGLRYRGVAARAETLPRDLVVLELRRVRRAPGRDPLSPRGRRSSRVLRTR